MGTHKFKELPWYDVRCDTAWG